MLSQKAWLVLVILFLKIQDNIPGTLLAMQALEIVM